MSAVISNLTQIQGQVAAWVEAVKLASAETAMGLAHEAFEQILATGPQNSGDFVANTKVAVGQPDTSFTPSAVGVVRSGMFKMGDSDAQVYARDRANFAPGNPGQSVFVSSSPVHDGGGYAVDIENGNINLRDVNEGADFIYRRAVMVTAHNYKTINKTNIAKLRALSQ